VYLWFSVLSTSEPIHRFHEIWYGNYGVGDTPDLVLLNFLQSVITAWRAHKPVRESGTSTAFIPVEYERNTIVARKCCLAIDFVAMHVKFSTEVCHIYPHTFFIIYCL
jgi:hypothetical protein